jgi:outer membrane protein
MVTLRRIRRAVKTALSLMLLSGLLAPVGFSRGSAFRCQQSNAEQPQSRPATDQGRTTEQSAPGGPPQLPLTTPHRTGFPDTNTLSEFAKPKLYPHAPAQDPAKPAQSKTPSAELDKSAITTPLPETGPVGPDRTGVDLNEVDNLTLQDAIRLALLNNLTIEQFRQGVQISQYSLFSARGVYDVTSGSTISYTNSTSPTAIIPADSGALNGALTSRTFAANFTTSQNFEPTGGSWLVSFNNARTVQTSLIDLLSPQYTTTLQVSIIQPLMRNLSIDANRQTIQIAKAQLDLSDSQFRQQVIQIINQVQDAYWELGFAIQNEKIARNTYDLTHKQLEDNRKQIEAGTLAPLDLRQTEATLEANKGTIIAAKQTVTNDENALKILLLKDPNDRIWNSVIKPLDDPEFESHSFSLSDAVALALKNRPELEQIRLQKLQNRININYFKNQLKPQLNLVALYSTTGFAGTPTPGAITAITPGGIDQLIEGSGLADLTAGQATRLITELNAALSGLGLNPFTPTLPQPTLISEIPGRFSGGYGTTLSQLFSQDFRTIQVGLTFSFPWKNRTAEGNLGQALALERQTEASEKALVTQIGINVRNALEAVEAARESYLAAVAGKEAAYAQYVGEEEKFRAGLSTTFFVLQQETAYATAQGTEARARANYRQALSDFQRVTATTLVSNNVEIPPTSQQPGQNQNP